MAVKQLMRPGKIVKKSNALARARYSADSVWEQRLVAWLASQIHSTDKDFQVYQIRIVDLVGNNIGGTNYKEIEKAVIQAMRRVIIIKDKKTSSIYNLFSKCKIDREKGIIELCFHPDLREHYLELKQWVEINFFEFTSLQSIYSQRIYEFLKSWSDKDEISIPLSDLHEMLETPVSLREKYKDFRVRVLDVAHRDILKHTNFEFNWEPIKNGRAVSEIKFIFPKKHKQSVSTNPPPNPQATLLLQKTLGIEPPKNTVHNTFLKFVNSFSDGGIRHLEAWKLWSELHSVGNAPTDQDVPANNQLAVMTFLEKWRQAHPSDKTDQT